ncbi:MAG: hypothetical protein H7Y28_14390 [Rhodoferax sp.]|nr:hypothetical protein [Rhodoferax sp.]
MGIQNNIQLIELREAEHEAVFAAKAADGHSSLTRLQCSATEFTHMERVAASRPFGKNQTHHIWLQGLKLASSRAFCLRVTSDGSRIDHWIEASEKTFEGLDFIFNQFALDPELVPDMPPCVTTSPTS